MKYDCVQCHSSKIEATIPKQCPRLCVPCKKANLKKGRDEREGRAKRVVEQRARVRVMFINFSDENQALFRAKYISPELVKNYNLANAVKWCEKLEG